MDAGEWQDCHSGGAGRGGTMKINSPATRLPKQLQVRYEAGIMLIECLVYLGVLAIILTVSYLLLAEGSKNESKFRGNAEQIIRTLKAGEAWRANVRSATAPVRLEPTDAGAVLHIPQGKAETQYLFFNQAVWTRKDAGVEWKLVLDQVKSSQVFVEPRQKVSTLRWELELISHEKRVRVQPVFTFLSVNNSPVTAL